MPDLELNHINSSLTDGTPYTVPYWRVDSGRPGPCVLVTSALHASELQGAEILRRVAPHLAQQLLCGSCLLVPFANPVAVKRRQPHIDFEHGRYYGADFVNNVNCTWPGDPDGSNAQRLSHALFSSVVNGASHLIDLHCWQHLRAATGLTRAGRDDCVALVNSTGLPFARASEWHPEITERPVTPCTLSSYFNDTDRVGICIEFSGQYGFWKEQLELGERALLNSLRHLEMLPGALEEPARPTIWLNESHEHTATAPTPGVFVPEPLSLGEHVESGALLGRILRLDDLGATEVPAPGSGCLFRFGPMHDVGYEQTRMFLHPHVEKGQELATLVEPKG